MTTTVLKATDLCKTFSNESVQQHVLKNLNIEIRKGDFTVIMGDSGAGKSTLLYSLSGMDRPSLGSIRYGDEEISRYNNDKLALFRRKHCGFVFQQNYLNDTMSVMDNIIVSGLLKSRDRKAIASRAKELLKQVGLDENCYNKFPNQLSGGEKQRVALVRSVINEPEILFADEPTGALNSLRTAISSSAHSLQTWGGNHEFIIIHCKKQLKEAQRRGGDPVCADIHGSRASVLEHSTHNVRQQCR